MPTVSAKSNEPMNKGGKYYTLRRTHYTLLGQTFLEIANIADFSSFRRLESFKRQLWQEYEKIKLSSLS